MAMYISRGELRSAADLYQGDILRSVLVPQPAIAESYVYKPDRTQIRFAKASHLAKSDPTDPTLRLCVEVERIDALVVSATCDNARGDQILLARIVPFKFKNPPNWLEVSFLATGTDVKSFYLPGDPTIGLDRSEARFTRLLTMDVTAVDRCLREAGTHRACGLTPEATQHLQWALSVFFGRHAREDFDWPSREDLDLKVGWLKEEIARGGPNAKSHQDELRAVEEYLRGLEPEQQNLQLESPPQPPPVEGPPSS